MVIHFESFGNFTTGATSYRALISKKSRGKINLNERVFSFETERDKIRFEIKIVDIENFYLKKRGNIPTIELQTRQKLHFNFYPHKKGNTSLSSSKKLTKALFTQLTRLVYRGDRPILYEAEAGLLNNSEQEERMEKGILLLTEDFLSFKFYNEMVVKQIPIKYILQIIFNDKNSPIEVISSENQNFKIITLKKQFGRTVNDSGKTQKLYEILDQAKVYKTSELIRLRKEEEERIQQIKSIFEVSNKVRLDMVRTALDMDEKTFTDKIFQWARKYKFVIDGDYLIVNTETINEFLENLKFGFDLSIKRDIKKDCFNCGKSIDITAKICPYCGKEQ